MNQGTDETEKTDTTEEPIQGDPEPAPLKQVVQRPSRQNESGTGGDSARDVEQFRAAFDRFVESFTSAKAETVAAQQKLANTTDQLTTATNTVAELKASLADRDGQLERFQTLLSAETTRATTAQQSLTEAQQTLDATRQELSTTQRNVEELTAQLNERNRHFEELRDQAEEQATEAQQTLDASRHELATVTATVRELRAQLNERDELIGGLRATIDTERARATQAEQKLKTTEQKLIAVEETVVRIEEARQALIKRSTDAETRATEVEQKLTSAEQELIAREQALARAEQKAVELTAELQERDSQTDEQITEATRPLQEQLATTKRAATELADRITNLNVKLTEQKERYETQLEQQQRLAEADGRDKDQKLQEALRKIKELSDKLQEALPKIEELSDKLKNKQDPPDQQIPGTDLRTRLEINLALQAQEIARLRTENEKLRRRDTRQSVPTHSEPPPPLQVPTEPINAVPVSEIPTLNNTATPPAKTPSGPSMPGGVDDLLDIDF